MNKNTQSPNTARAADEKATQRAKDLKALKKVKQDEPDKMNNPNLTAVIVEADSKTLKMKRVKTDELNDKIF